MEEFKVHGQTVVPYFQLYQNLDDDSISAGELLTRLEFGDSAHDLLMQLTVPEHLKLLEWLIHNSNQLLDKFGLRCSINVDDDVVMQEADREEFLRIVSLAKGPTTFEFTETHAMPDSIDANKLFRRLRDLGHKCALDDFGAGFNGMTLLTDYDFDLVKVDRALTVDIDVRPEKLQVLSLLNEMLKALNKNHIVEGVETKEIRDLLTQAGYRVFQGYVFDMPKPISELTQTTSKGNDDVSLK